MDVYMTSQGDTWELIALRVYGNQFASGPLIEANPEHMTTVIFPSGVYLTVPALPNAYFEAAESAPWRELT